MDDLITPSGATPQPPEKPKGKPQTFACPACGGVVTIKAVGLTISAICTHCSSVIDVANENFQIIKKANEKIRKTLLELGVRGKLFGAEWEVIGYTKKRDGDYTWEEYLLYNPYHGFRFLVQSGGHWNFIKILKKDIPGAGVANEVWLNSKKYELFLKGEAVVDYVKGEYYWRVKEGERASVADYVAPPYMLSTEKNAEEMTVSLGEYLEPGQVAAAFKLDKEMPRKMGVAANQPAPFQGALLKMWIITVVAIVLATMIHNMTVKAADNADVYANQFNVDWTDRYKTQSTPSFVIPKKSNVLIQSFSSVNNDWLELNLSLVNEQTNKEYGIVQGMEYYHGQDIDGPWAEGKQNKETFISSVPAGNYRLLIDTEAGAFPRGLAANFVLKIKRDVPCWSNYGIIFLLLLFYPIFVTLRRYSFENQRWSESDYVPPVYTMLNIGTNE